MTAKILTLDIETSPNLADVWGLWDQNVGLSQLRKASQVIAWAGKWYGKPRVEFRSDFHDGHELMVQRAHAVLDEADIVVHYNGTSFDLPHLRREFLLAGLQPPSPVLEIDLLKTVRKVFKFPSNKLQYVSTAVGLSGKVEHQGHELWVACMQSDPKAWALMKKYNIGDVVLEEQLYDVLRPWLKSAPHLGLYGAEGDVCSRCGSANLRREGFAHTTLGSFQQYQCKECGGWSRGKKALQIMDARGI